MTGIEASIFFPGIPASTCCEAAPRNRRLLMVFLGWGMSPAPFAGLSKPGYDIMLLWNYKQDGEGRFADSLRENLSSYGEIVVVAWSFGVVAASYILDVLAGMPVTRKIAVNGTPAHIDRRKGIPPAVFALTLRGMSPEAVDKFTDRMFSNEVERNAFKSYGSSRDFNSLLDELRLFGELRAYQGAAEWDFAVIGGRDTIFPPENQTACWTGTKCRITRLPECGHYIDLQSVIDDFVVDKELVASRFGSTRDSYRDSAGAQRLVAEKLWRLARAYVPTQVDSVLEIGVGEGLLTGMYMPDLNPESLTLWDIAEVDITRFPGGTYFERCDAEEAICQVGASSVDLILSASTIQWFHSPERFITNAVKALKPGGILAVAFFCEGTYSEIASITGVSLKYPDPESWRVDGQVLLLEKERLTESYADSVTAVRHIGRTGVNALRRDHAASVAAGRKLLRWLPVNADGSVSLTYIPCYLIIRKPI